MLILARTVNILRASLNLYPGEFKTYSNVYHVYNVPIIFCQSHSQFRYVSMYC